MAEKYGLWVNDPGRWVGWAGFAAGDIFVPHKFDHDEAQERASNYKAARSHKTEVEVIANPPDELPWSKNKWREAVGNAS